jgi:hypothetical protein
MGLMVPLTGLFRGCEGRFGNAGTSSCSSANVPHSLTNAPNPLPLPDSPPSPEGSSSCANGRLAVGRAVAL